ncbi:MAG: glycosyltransferase [Planctomycetota bacterium]|nr:MAG: glycosyltransferase [Planctomycetota bacterium]
MASAKAARNAEVLVVDGGSTDATPRVAADAGARVLRAPRGRAAQMNAGAAAASGRYLLFLHADSRLPADYAAQVRRLFRRPRTKLGAFRLTIDHPRRAFRMIEWAANMRSRWLRSPYGDQGLAMRASDFYALGGFRDLPIMEDYDLARRVAREADVAIADTSVQTSPRRWLRHGVWRLTLIHQACLLAYRWGAAPERIAQWRGTETASPPAGGDTTKPEMARRDSGAR